MRHLPSIEALSDVDDRRMLAELEIRQMLEKLARVRHLVERADRLLTVLACGELSVEAEAVSEEEASVIPINTRKR